MIHAPLRELTLNIILRISLFTPHRIEKAVTILLRNMLRIDDTDEQAASFLGLLPFLPKSMTEGSLADLRNPDIVGKEVACFASMMLVLAQALSADALSDMVEAALGHYSEWWVVETLSVICRRITERIEFSALRGASLYIINLDLRARVLGRLATRAVDVGLISLGIEIAQSIELHAAKWEELRQLCLRIASAGEPEMALEAVDTIPFTQERNRAYAEIALEIAAQGLIKRAREVVDTKIDDSVWRNWTNRLLTADPESGNSFEPEHIQTRKFSRTLSAEGKDRSLLIAAAATSLEETGLSQEGLEKVRAALTCQNEAELETAILGLWNPTNGSGSDFLKAILADGRPKALKRIARLGHLLPTAESGSYALEIFSAIRRVTAWWP